MDVGGIALDGIDEDEVAEPDDGCVVGALGEVGEVDGRASAAVAVTIAIGVVEVEVAPEALHIDALLVVLGDGLADGRLGGYDDLDVVGGEELEVVDGRQVGRVGHGDDEGSAGAVDGDAEVARGYLLGHEIDDLALDVEVGQRDGGDTIGLGEELGELRLVDEA